ncbi:MAG: thioredoxin domain-containing protein, partial [Myxococcota bacterium]
MPEALPGAPAFGADLHARLERALAARADRDPRTRHRADDGSPRFSNRLLLEASPYLLQHAHNPVNWFPWGDEAFAAAKRLGRPVLVSIGYSTCHWCHVMEEESFDDVEIARLLNEHFIAIKVDREARPDVDAHYMAALQAMGRSGGWPLNVWVTPDREPFFGGTYFPPRDRPGRPGFPRVLRALLEVWEGDPARVRGQAAALSRELARQLAGATPAASRAPDPAWLARRIDDYQARFDPVHGGLRGPQKFPASLPVRLLLRLHRRSGDPRARAMATRTLEAMAAGGIHDHVGGGFHRYAVDDAWRVPHFEKMLYDNALITLAFVEAWQVTG